MPEQSAHLDEKINFHSIRREYQLDEQDCNLIASKIARGNVYCGILPRDMTPNQYLEEFEVQARKLNEERKKYVLI